MKVDMLMPQMGESIAEATISKWLVAEGDKVEKDQTILEISTDKVDSEIPAPESGVVSQLLFKEGDVVPVKEKIAVIDTDASAAATNGSAAKSEAAPAPQTPTPQSSAPSAEKSCSAQNGNASDKYYSPLVRSLAEKHGVSLSELDSITGTGQSGRVTKEDFLSYVAKGSAKPAASAAASPAPSPPQQGSTQQASAPQAARPAPQFDWSGDDFAVEPMDNMRQAIAEHMVRSKQTSPHVYSIQEIDCTNIAKWRSKVQGEFLQKEGFKLSFTPFFLEAAVQALRQFPYVNCSLDGKKIILKKHINLGCAVALGSTGLIVPVIKNAEEKNFVGVARALTDLANRARTKKLKPDDVAGGTFTVTNPGVFGTIIGTPIINQPQVAILCLGAIEKRPVVIDDMIAIRQMCYLTLSYDHRIVDGSLGGQFLAFIRDYLEGWDMNRGLA